MTTKSLSILSLLAVIATAASAQTHPVKYVRYDHAGQIKFGVLEDGQIAELEQNFLHSRERTGTTIPLDEVKLLAPVEPKKVIAVGLNYKSHGGDETTPEPPIFLKLPTCIVGPDDEIVLPADAKTVHLEAEMVLVVGKKAKNVPVERAKDYIFGVTCGNDVSARAWQASDLQWFRGKAVDTFGPVGPAVVTGLDYDDLLLEGRLNGETVQSQRTSDLIHGAAAIVSFISQYVTLEPGDVIFTGTPGRTTAVNPSDTVEIELEGVGVLSNPVVREGG